MRPPDKETAERPEEGPAAAEVKASPESIHDTDADAQADNKEFARLRGVAAMRGIAGASL